MSFGATVLLGLALSATVKGAPPAPAKSAAAPSSAVVCRKYRVRAEKSDLATDQEVTGWATAALERASLLDNESPCYVHVRITAGPIRSGGRQDGWMAHVGVSTRASVKDGKLVTREKGMLFVEPLREGLVAKARSFVEEFVAKLRPEPAGSVTGSDEG